MGAKYVFNPLTGNLDTTDVVAFNGEVEAGTAAAPSVFFTGDPNTGIYSPGADQLAISTNGQGRLFINANGDSRFTQSIIATKADGTTTAGQIARSSLIITGGSQDDLGIATAGHFRIATGGAVETFRFTSDGKLSLGTSSPQAKLHVGAISSTSGGITAQATIQSDTTLAVGASGETTLSIIQGSSQISSAVGLVAGVNAGLPYFSIKARTDAGGNAVERLRIDGSGRLLVGTSSDSGGALLQVNGDRIRVGSAKTPASATDTGTAGEICWDADYVYVCTATNTWKRTAIATW